MEAAGNLIRIRKLTVNKAQPIIKDYKKHRRRCFSHIIPYGFLD